MVTKVDWFLFSDHQLTSHHMLSVHVLPHTLYTHIHQFFQEIMLWHCENSMAKLRARPYRSRPWVYLGKTHHTVVATQGQAPNSLLITEESQRKGMAAHPILPGDHCQNQNEVQMNKNNQAGPSHLLMSLQRWRCPGFEARLQSQSQVMLAAPSV